MHRGVATAPSLEVSIAADDVEIEGVEFTNGMLIIKLQKIVPDHQKLKVYEIS